MEDAELRFFNGEEARKALLSARDEHDVALLRFSFRRDILASAAAGLADTHPRIVWHVGEAIEDEGTVRLAAWEILKHPTQHFDLAHKARRILGLDAVIHASTTVERESLFP